MGLKSKPVVEDPRAWVGCAAALVLLFLPVLVPDAVTASVRQSLQLCAGTVIPSLFPFLIASELLVRSGAADHVGKRMSAPFCRLFGISHCGAVVCLMGVFCGFPVGARTAAAYAARGRICEAEYNRLLLFCNVPSAAFVMGAVGNTLFGDAVLGRRLYACVLLSAAVVGLLDRLVYGNCAAREAVGLTMSLPVASDSRRQDNPLVCAAMGMLSVVATVVAFGALKGALGALIGRGLPVSHRGQRLLACILSCLLEMTGGVAEAAKMTDYPSLWSHLMTAAALGWGGLSIHYQLLGAGRDGGVAVRPGRFFFARLLQASLCAAFLLLWERATV